MNMRVILSQLLTVETRLGSGTEITLLNCRIQVMVRFDLALSMFLEAVL